MNINKTFNVTNIFLRIPFTAFRSMSLNNVSNENALSYCTNIVRQHDYENFLATLLMTKSIRSPALVVRAFNVEVARIQDQTTDTQTAAFRLQFWQDTLVKIYKKDQTLSNIPANPIAQELFKVTNQNDICSCYSLPKRQFDKLITSRSDLLKTRHFRNLDDVEKYAENAVSPIFYLVLNVAGINDIHADHAASHLGKAQGIANILRSIHVSNRHKMVSLPMDILMKHKVSQEQVLRGKDSENMRNVSFEIASQANSHLQKARNIAVPKLAKQIFLPAISTSTYLAKLQKQHFDIFDPSLQKQNVILPLNFYYKRLMNKY